MCYLMQKPIVWREFELAYDDLADQQVCHDTTKTPFVVVVVVVVVVVIVVVVLVGVV